MRILRARPGTPIARTLLRVRARRVTSAALASRDEQRADAMIVHNLKRLAELQAELAPETATGGAPSEALARSIADDIAERAARVAKVAALHAEEVDRDGRFPPRRSPRPRRWADGADGAAELGGEGASLGDVADICYALGRACASTAMIYAMHQVKVACVVRHGIGSAWHEDFIRRLVRDQLLLASSTTEGQGGGNVRSSEAPIERRPAAASAWSAPPASSPTAPRPTRSSPPRAATPTPPPPTRCSPCSRAATTAWSARSPGTRSACAAPAAPASRCAPRARRRRSCRLPTSRSTPRAWCRPRISSGRAPGPASPPAAVEQGAQLLRKARGAAGELPPSAPYFTRANASLRAAARAGRRRASTATRRSGRRRRADGAWTSSPRSTC